MPNKTGLSLSFCVADIARDKVKESDVEKIVAATAAGTDDEWAELLNSYCKVYWREFPRKAKAIANRLRREGKIEQPRLQGTPAHNIANGHWLVNGQQTRL